MAEGADVPLLDAVPDASCRCPPDVCVAVVLGDALRRVSLACWAVARAWLGRWAACTAGP
jgi:hypothetical protein